MLRCPPPTVKSVKIKVRCQKVVNMDAKGRLALPSKIRSALADMGETSLVLMAYVDSDGEPSVWGWTNELFEAEVEGPLEGQDPFSSNVRDFLHSVSSTAQDVDLDGQGRILIPPELREQGGLNQKECAIFVVQGHIEIWSKDGWERRLDNARQRQQARQRQPGREPLA